jgi:type III pantothenate kinase
MLGVDRWLAIVGAATTYGKPLVVWDLGTATTLDAVDASGQHLGGWILPGPRTMLDGLRQDAKLDTPESIGPESRLRPGRRTRDCIINGVLAAQIGAARLFLRELGGPGTAPPVLVLAGGAAPTVRDALGQECVYDPWLVFRGMLVN